MLGLFAMIFSTILYLELWFFVKGAPLNHTPAIFIFGDSLADVGNNDYIPFSSLRVNYFPYGIDFPRRIPTGRFSNGRLVLDFVASNLGLQVPLPYLSPEAKGLDLLHGVNYASGGCGILNETTRNSKGCLSLSAQVRYHTQTRSRIIEQLGEDTEAFFSRALFFIVIGSNDFLGNYISNNSGGSNTPSFMQFRDHLISSLDDDIQILYGEGARRVILMGLGPLGCIPSQIAKSKNGTCNEDLNDWAQGLNMAFTSLVKGLSLRLEDLLMTFVNPYPILKDFIDNPLPYGFEVTNKACCGGGKMNAQIPCLPLFICCLNRTNHIFWDPWHPTEATNELLANAFLSNNSTSSYPWSIRQLANLDL
ncbi:hypothetical protein KP509_29G023100 [Ceratopteris richardii]|uniref:Uncharacterized protein n=1 Tax=Ceratopteris richardii TaxID=49495 RepID=A0A8T2R5I7_CERRI|nr:hypothetical protein KP509_29G023100 [Ceratopteris richardii]